MGRSNQPPEPVQVQVQVQVPVLIFDTFQRRAALNITTACGRVANVGGTAEVGKAGIRRARGQRTEDGWQKAGTKPEELAPS
jgi:hypothetical protein